MHKIITIATPNVFTRGLLCLNSFKNCSDHMTIYGVGFSERMKRETEEAGAEYVDASLIWPNFARHITQFKYKLIDYTLSLSEDDDVVTLIDFDTMIVQDWSKVFDVDFDIGITVEGNTAQPFAWANSGVVYAKNTRQAREFLDWAGRVVLDETYTLFPEAVEMFRASRHTNVNMTLRPISSKLTNFFIDQCVLSAVYSKWVEEFDPQQDWVHAIPDPDNDHQTFNFKDTKFGIFDCRFYNYIHQIDYDDILDKMWLETKYLLHFIYRNREAYDQMLIGLATGETDHIVKAWKK